MKTRAAKTYALLLLTFTLLLCAAISLPRKASAATSAVVFDVIQQANGVTYAASNYCDKGMKEIKNGYTFCVAGDIVYYLVDDDVSMPYAVKLYVSKLDGSGKKLLADYLTGNAFLLNSKIYYDGAANNQGKSEGIYCLDIKTGNKKKLLPNASLISIYDDTIYYQDSKNRVYSCTLTAGKKERLTDMSDDEYGVVSDGIFFAKSHDDDAILALDVKAPTRYSRVALADEYSYFMVDAGWVYYLRNNALYKCKTTAEDGNGEVKLCQVSADAYSVYPIKVVGRTLYFVEEINSDAENILLYKVSVNGGLKAFTGRKWFES